MKQLSLDGIPKVLEATKEKVEEILSIYPETRDDDSVFLQTFYKHFYNLDFPSLKGKPYPETLTRCRRKLQENGKFAAKERVTLVRDIRREKIREHYSKGEK